MNSKFFKVGLVALFIILLFSCEKESKIIPVIDVLVSPSSFLLQVGIVDTLKVTISPSNATNKTVSWSSSDMAIATVSSSGLVTGIAPGIDTIKVTTADGNKTATCIVTVIAPVTGIKLSPVILSLNVGTSDTLKVTITPSNASNKSVSWSSDNTSIASVSSTGIVTGISTGNVTITATTADGNKLDKCIVWITEWTTYKKIDGLASDTVWTIAVEPQGLMWFGGSNERGVGGVSEFDGSHWTIYTKNNSGLIDNTVNTIAIDAQNNKWIGCGINTSGISKFDGTNWTSYSTGNSGLVSNIIITMAIDAQNNKWFGTFSGVSKFDDTNWTSYSQNNSGLINDMLFTIAIDAQNNKWFGTFGGVSKFDGSNWTSYLAGSFVHSIAIDAHGNKWFGTNDGVSKFDGINWTSYNTGNSGLSNNQVFAIAIDAQHGIEWFGTMGGVSKFDGTNWISYTTSNSNLTDNKVYSIAIDKQGNKWFGTFYGVSKLQD